MRPILIVLTLTLSGCGMNSAVGVLPNTLDNLENEAAAARGEPVPGEEGEQGVTR